MAVHRFNLLVLGIIVITLFSSRHALAQETRQPPGIAMSEIGTAAGKQYTGGGLSVTPKGDGALLRCLFQRLDGEATPEGLWLVSMVESQLVARFSVKAVGLGRDPVIAKLPDRGPVAIKGNVVNWARPALIEEYSTSMDGVRQDFVIPEKPAGEGPLRVELAVAGAKAEAGADGARIVLDGTGRTLAYNRLKVVDARDKELSARIDVVDGNRLAVIVNDAEAVYPIRIDPTFSDANWVSMGGLPGANGGVRAFAVDTNSGVIYVGGRFTIMGDEIAMFVAKWDGTDWRALGSGMNSNVFDLAVDGSGNLYGAGDFTNAGGVSANRIAKWDGSAWNALGSGLNDTVYALALDGSGNVYAGGAFTTAGGISASRIAKWDGNVWNALDSGADNTVFALALDKADNVYAGGYFTNAGDISANYIAKWNGSTWSALGAGMDTTVLELAMDGSNTLYAGGHFTIAGGVSVNYIAKWNGSAWSALGSGMNGFVSSLTVDGSGNIYAGGDYITAGDISANYIAKWNGSAWSALGSGVNNAVWTLTVDGSGSLYAGGDFTTAQGLSASRIAKWNGSAWNALSAGMDNSVGMLACDGADNLYAGGSFTVAGGVSANRIAKWNGSAWSALGSGINNAVWTLTVDGSGSLYAGGDFTTAGGVSAKRIAKWNGSAWSALGSGMNSTINALAVEGSGNIYAGGAFTNAGGISASRIAKWNGSTWSALGSGMNSTISALAVDGSGNIYAGGAFTNAGGISANRIAKWNGSAWSALGSGMNNIINALAVDESGNVYAGGPFTNAGGVSASRIAKWNGSAWSALGSGMNNTINALAVDESGNVYAGGMFTNAGGVSASRIAKWNGSVWSALGSGMNNTINALAVDESGTLYAGGTFTFAGTNVSTYLARTVLGKPSAGIHGTNGASIANGDAASYGKGTDYGSVLWGQSRTNWFTVWNTGSWTLSITGMATNGTGASAFRVIGFPPGVTVGAVSNFAVAFSPSAAQAYTCIVAIANNSDQTPYNLCFSGTGVKRDQTIAFPPPGEQYATNIVRMGATASSGLPVSFAVASGPGLITEGTNLSFTGAGMVSVAAGQEGDASWNPAPGVTNTFRVYGVYTLAIASAYGTTTPATGAVSFIEGAVVTNSAVAPAPANGTQVVCLGWAMTGHDPENGTTAGFVMTVTNDAGLTWRWGTNHWLAVSNGANGTVAVTSGWQAAGATTSILARADANYRFTHWTGDVTGGTMYANPLNLQMDAPKAVTAWFTASVFTITPSNGPMAGGNTVTISGMGNGLDVTQVLIQGVAATMVSQTATSVTVAAGAGLASGPGTVAIQSAGPDSIVITNGYTYNPPGSISGTILGWTAVSNLPARRRSFGAAAVNGKIHVVAGFDGVVATNTHFVYDPAQPQAGWRTASNLPVAGQDLAAAPAANRLYAFGGYTGNVDRSTVYAYDPAAPEQGWSNAPSMPAGLSTHAGAAVDRWIYAIGGNRTSATNAVARLDTANPSLGWTSVSNLPARRSYLAAASLHGHLYAIGGQSEYNTAQSSVYRLNGAYPERGWTNISSLPGSRNVLAASTLDGRVLAIGGADGGGYRDSVFAYNPSLPQDGWQPLNALPEARILLGAATVGRDIYAIGGYQTNTTHVTVFRGRYSSGLDPQFAPLAGGNTIRISGFNLGNGRDITNVTLCGVQAAIVTQTAWQVTVIAGNLGVPATGDAVVCSTSYGATVASNEFMYAKPELWVLGTNQQVIADGEAASSLKGTDFGVMIGTNAVSRTLAIWNPAWTVSISGLATQGPYAAAFAVTGMPAQVRYASTSNFVVRFQSAASGVFTATVEIANNSDITPYRFGVSGVRLVISTNTGPMAGGNPVTLTGINLAGVTNLSLAGVPVAILSQSDTQIVFAAGAGVPGTGPLVIDFSDQPSLVFSNAYTYNPPGAIHGCFEKWVSISNLPLHMRNTSAASVDGQVYVVGGFQESLGTLSNCYRYRPAQPEAGWTRIANLPAERSGAGLVEGGGALYAIGGFNASNVPQTSVFRYDVALDAWSAVSNLPAGRGSLAAASVNGALYAAGGYSNGTWSQAYRYDTAQPQAGWTAISNLPAARAFLAGVATGGRIYAMGGASGSTPYDSVYRYDPARPQDGWTTLTNLPATRTDFAAASLDGAIYAIAGNSSFTVNSPQSSVYSLQTTKANAGWSNSISLPAPRMQLACTTAGRRLYALGGYRTATTNTAYEGVVSPAVDPASSLLSGGVSIRIAGSDLGNGYDITNVTLCGVAATITGQSRTSVVVTAGAAAESGEGAVVVYSTSFGATAASLAFEYLSPIQHALSVTAANGTVIRNPDRPLYDQGSQVTLTAQAAPYYHFEGWAGDVAGGEAQSNPLALLMNAPKSVLATFAANVAARNTPHWWLAQYGLGTNDAAETHEDGDGIPAWQEYIANTDPTNAASVFHVAVISNLPPWTVYFDSYSNREYTLESTTNLIAGPWAPLAPSNVTGEGGPFSLADTNPPAPNRFWRVRVRLPPE